MILKFFGCFKGFTDNVNFLLLYLTQLFDNSNSVIEES